MLMPVSDLPMPADDRSQRQVLLEKKAELTGQAQDIEDSSLPPRAKQAALGAVRQKIGDASRGSEQKLLREDVKKREDRRTADRERIAQTRTAQENRQADARSAAIRESAGAGGDDAAQTLSERTGARLDIRA
jgi:hypothetical protein